MDNRIIPFTYSPNPDKKRVYPALFGALAVGSVLTVMSVSVERFRGLISLGAVLFLGAAMFFFVRYVGQEFVYNVDMNSNDEPMLVISKVIGKRISTMCAIPLYSIISIQKFTKTTGRYVPNKKIKRHNFVATFGADSIFVIKSETRYDKCEIVIECTDEMAARLNQYVEIAKEIEKESGEE